MSKDRKFSALIQSKVSKVSKGLSHVSTTIDPDWDRNLLIAIHNPSRSKIILKFAEPFCTIVFFENKTPSTKDCGKVPGRLDIFVKEWSVGAKKAKRKEALKTLIPVGIILMFLFFGYRIFGNSSGFVAMTACGVALSQLIKIYL